MDENSINEFVDEGVEVPEEEQQEEQEQAAASEQETEGEAANKEDGSDTQSSDEAAEQVKSFLQGQQGDDNEDDNEDEAQVPAHVVKKLREERRELREKLAKLENAKGNTRPDAGNSDVADKDDFSIDIDDDDFLTGAQVKETLKKQNEAIQRRIDSALSQKEKESAQQAKMAQIETLTKQTAEKHEDFGDVTKYGQSLLTKADQSAIRQAENPAEALYARCKERLTEDTRVRNKLLGIETETSKNKPAESEKQPQTQDEILQTPDEVFDEVFGGGSG